jgi:hypothetical protein
MVNFNFKRVMAALLMMAAMQVSAAVRPAAKDTALVKMYKDSLALYKAQLDSARTLNSAYTAFDKYKLFSSSTFYNDVAQEKLGLDGATKDSLNKEIDAALMNIYLKHPELIKVSETKLDEAGAVKQEIKEPIENKETIVEKAAEAVVDQVAAPEPEVVVKKPNFWTYKGDYNVQFLQNYFSGNWHKGGESNYSMLAAAVMEANYYNKSKLKWDNKLEMKVGFMTSRSDSLHKFKTTEDLIRLTSMLGLQATKKWYYTLQVIAESQFYRGYKSNDLMVYSDFFSPFKLNVALGMTYNVEWFNKKLTGTINLSPIALNYRYVGRTWFPNQNAENPADYSWFPSRHGVDADKHHLLDPGSQVTADLQWKLSETVTWKSRFWAFTSYHRAEVEWENTFQLKVSKYISANIFLYPRFDDGNAYDDDLGYWQFKEYTSIGLSYSF